MITTDRPWRERYFSVDCRLCLLNFFITSSFQDDDSDPDSDIKLLIFQVEDIII
jgi:hypothetical protein